MIVIDRIEENIVVIDRDGEIEALDIEKFALPIREGDVVIQKDGIFTADHNSTEARRKEIIEKMKRMGLK